MVFESLLTPKQAEQYPWLTFIIAFLLSSLAILLSWFIFPDNISLTFTFLTTFFFIPLFYLTMQYEESKDETLDISELGLLKEHSKALWFFLFLFIGLLFSFCIWYIFLSTQTIPGFSSDTVFASQLNTLISINGKVTASFEQSIGIFWNIFGHNMRVLVFCILFSFLYGAGAIYILVWNSSVIGVALARYIMALVPYVHFAYVGASGCGIVRYLIHGIPEIVAYFVAGLAGGIISAAIIKKSFGSPRFEKILIDVSVLLLISIVILFFAGLIEVFITPSLVCSVSKI